MSQRYAWLSDTHLDHLDEQGIVTFADRVAATGAAGILWTGDISTGSRLISHLAVVEQAVQRPIMFICGNHDYYGTSVEWQRKQIEQLATVSPYLKYLSKSTYMMLTPDTALVGHDGWYDAGYGDPLASRVVLNDWSYIAEYYANNGVSDIMAISRKLAHEGVTHVMKGIKEATRYARHVIVLTHVPPFESCATYRGGPSEPGYLPWYTSKFMGDMLVSAAKAFPDRDFTVFCGHTHGACSQKIAKNLIVRVAGAEYGKPVVQDLVEVV